MTCVRTATVAAPRQLEIREDGVPSPASDQVVVRIRYCGVCGTDVHGFEAPELLPPAVFGHEWTGTIVDAGGAVESVGVGDRVSVAVGPPCGRCSMCRSGNADNCDTAFAEANGVTPDAPDHGGFATHLAVSERRVVKLLDGLTDEQAALVEPTAVTFRAVRRTTVPLGSVVVVQGAEPIGLLCAQQARHAGAGHTFVVEPVPARRAAAAALGFADAFEPGAASATPSGGRPTAGGRTSSSSAQGWRGSCSRPRSSSAGAGCSRSSGTPSRRRRSRTATG